MERFPVPRVKFLLVIPTSLNMKERCAESARQVRTGTTIRASVKGFRVGLADLLHDRERVKGAPAREGDRQLVKIRGTRQQRGRNEGMGAQEEVAGVVLVVVRRVSSQQPHMVKRRWA